MSAVRGSTVPGFIVRGSALLLGACVLAACKVGPNFVAPNEPVPNRYSGAAIDSTAPAASAPRPSGDSSPEPFWWQEFHDTELNRLEERAAAGNLDLKAAFIHESYQPLKNEKQVALHQPHRNG